VKPRLFLLASCAVLLSTLVIRVSAGIAPSTDGGHELLAGHTQPECGGEPCDAVQRGQEAFLDRALAGLDANGRACADCHMPVDEFQLSPAHVEKRFTELERRRRTHPEADDPLFRAIDADDFRVNRDQAHDFSNLRQNGLVRITFALPPRIALIDPATNNVSGETFVDVWRSVPTVNDVALTGIDDENPWFRGPNKTGGYQLDARFATLQEQALAAFTSHAQAANPVPQQMLDDLASFQRVLFTNPRVRALAEAMREGTTPLPDPDPELDELEEQGKVVFERACANCHGGPRQSTTPLGIVRYHSIASQCPRPVDVRVPARFAFAPCEPRLARNARTYAVRLAAPTPGPGGLIPAETIVRLTSSDPGRALLTGYVGGPPPLDDWNKFDVSGLRGIRRTAPYFHNNSADTLEAVVDHYIELYKLIKANAPPGPPPPVATTDGVTFNRQPLPEERAALLAYLKKL
jgi:cytochrome c peroxidase